MTNEETITAELINTQFGLQIAENDFMQFRKKLVTEIEYLINHQFEKLLWLLYRIDVSEQKAKEQLTMYPDKAAEVLSDLIIERQMQKAKNRSGGNNFLDF